MDYIIYFGVTIGVLVFVHEFGHFIAARLCGMQTDVFAIGFGKRLFGWNQVNRFTFGNLPKDFDMQGHTDYRLCLLPLGGYVKIAGMVDESFDTGFANQEPQPHEFRSKSTLQKSFVITAGVLMNLLLALAVFWGVNFYQGKQLTKTTTIGYVAPGSPEAEAGFMVEDKILAINNTSIEYWEDLKAEIFINTLGQDLNFVILREGTETELFVPRTLIPDDEQAIATFLLPAEVRPIIADVIGNSPANEAGVEPGDLFLSLNEVPLFSSQQATEIIKSNPEKTLPLSVLRGADTLQMTITPGADGLIGVQIGNQFFGDIEYRTFGFFESFYYAGLDIVKMTTLFFSMISKVFSGDIEFGKAFGGPVKIAQFAVKSADSGIASFLMFLALLSLSLAIINILPFPVLDGGHLVIILVEGLIKKEIPVKIKIAVQNVGFVLLLLLMAFIIYNDILNF